MICVFFFFKQKTAYEMRISDWSSDVCSSDLLGSARRPLPADHGPFVCDAHDDGEWPLARSRTHEEDAHDSDDHGSEPRTHPGRVSGWAGAPSHDERPARPAIFLESVRICRVKPYCRSLRQRPVGKIGNPAGALRVEGGVRGGRGPGGARG